MLRFLTAFLCAFLTASALWAVEIPDWAKAKIDETQKRIDAWKGDDLCVIFPYMTDIHSRSVTIADPIDWSDSKMHIYIGQQAARQMKVDFFADLGDMEIEMVPKTPEEVESMLASKQTIYRDFDLPALFSMGNHDHGKNRIVSSDRFGEMFNGMTAAKGFKLVFGESQSWGFYDLPEKKTRVFFTNTSDDGYYGLSVSQLQFIADHLADLEEGWTAVIMQHFCVQVVIGHWTSWPNCHAKNEDVFIKMCEDFVANRSGGMNGVKWDFTANKDTRLAGCFYGDSHFDHHLLSNGVHYSISQGYGGVNPKELPDDQAVHTNFNRASECLVDVVVIKPEKREVKIFRVGAGGEARDREYTY